MPAARALGRHSASAADKAAGRARMHAAGIAAAQELRLWDQCGGEGGSCKEAGTCVDGPFPGKACPSGSSCLKQSNWYYQCLPTGEAAGPGLACCQGRRRSRAACLPRRAPPAACSAAPAAA